MVINGHGSMQDIEHEEQSYGPHVPSTLVKASYDTCWPYVLKLRTGDIIFFNGCDIIGDFATLYTDGDWSCRDSGSCGVAVDTPPPPHNWFAINHNNRGVEVRISDIVWITESGS